MSVIDITTLLVDFIKRVETRLPSDVENALKKLQVEEDNPLQKIIYEAMLSNINEAKKKQIPLCQDTGILMFFIKAGVLSPLITNLKEKIIEATRRATLEIPLRPNAVDPITNNNSGDNTGRYVPWIHWDDILDNDLVEIGLYVAGGGSSFPGRAQVFSPVSGWNDLVRYVFDIVARYGINACPPLIIGIGIGATVEIASILSKKALFRKIGQRHENKKIALIEETLLKGLNELKIGAQGLEGKHGVIDVHIEYSYRHPATFAVGVTVSCWALRRGVLVIRGLSDYEFRDYW